MDCILQTERLSKEFKGFVAVHNVNLRVGRGSIHALVGPSGAGKTTCFNLLTKLVTPTSGRIFFDGDEITQETPSCVAERGVVRLFQIPAALSRTTVLETVRAALQRKASSAFHFWKPERPLHMLDERAMALLHEVGLGAYAEHSAAELCCGRKRVLQMAVTLAMEPELMLLDEPTKGLGAEDVDRILQLIKQASAGRTILMAEHELSAVSDIADAVTLLQGGTTLAEGSYAEVSRNHDATEVCNFCIHEEFTPPRPLLRLAPLPETLDMPIGT